MSAITSSLLLILVSSSLITASQDGATDLSAAERGLTATDVKAVLLAREGNRYHTHVTHKNFKGKVLGYVTPWNSHGYDVATRWRAKFTHISPVWYQIRADDAGTGFKLTGGHDVDQDWIARLREPVDSTSTDGQCSSDGPGSATCSADAVMSTAPPLVIPRVIFELQPPDLLRALEEQPEIIDMIVGEINTQGLDGVVLEGWLQWSGMGVFKHEQLTQAVLDLVTGMGEKLHSAGKVLILAIPPVVPSDPGRPNADLAHMQKLSAAVDGFSLMTYDYATAGPGPNFPLTWQEQNVKELVADAGSSEGSKAVKPDQVLMGVPFYGYDFSKPDQADSSSKKGTADNQDLSANPIMGEAFLAVLRKVKPKLKWEEQHAEHKVKYKDGGFRHTVYYPTPAALEARLKLAEQLGVGLSIWELGQGMDSFLDLL